MSAKKRKQVRRNRARRRRKIESDVTYQIRVEQAQLTKRRRMRLP